MSRYTGPKLKIIRRLGELPGLTTKEPGSMKRPGQHGDSKRKVTQYSFRLAEKQKLRYHYGLTERQLVNYVRKVKKNKGATGDSLLRILEMRLDNVVFRFGIGKTIRAARQEVSHRHIYLNSLCVSFPGYQCKIGDQINVDRSLFHRSSSEFIGGGTLLESQVWERHGVLDLPRYLELLPKERLLRYGASTPDGIDNNLPPVETEYNKIIFTQPSWPIGKILRDPGPRDVPFVLNVLLVIEYYSRKI